ncbi:hypothetical protein [Nocardia terpenica]|uniref:Uncharacterized protein n=1 Tax=Nocardia terpenica TaxID=455432 RepID=A0A291RUH0_9NOCA|nr:hypothetical protein [Nocardia terpenica]ATL70985.1 hypothetical protein CRH09_37225 [Nocardia terpenica]
MSNSDVIATVLGYPDAGVMAAEQGPGTAYRLAYLLDVPAEGVEALMVLDRLLELFLAEDGVPESSDVQGLVDQTHRIATGGVPVDEDFLGVVAEALGCADDPDPAQTIYQINSRVVRFLAKSVMIARGDTDRFLADAAE